MQGKVTHLIQDRGFGFLSSDEDRSKDGSHFFHAKDVVGRLFDLLEVGSRVEFESTSNDRGLAARNVTLIED